MEQTIRFCATRAGRIAYATAGEGPALVFPAWWVSDLEANWEDPSFRAFLLALAHRHTVVRYDRVGTGLSERRPGERAPTLEAEVEVLGELLDHVGLSRCTLFGFSSGGCISAVYTAAHPARVTRLVLYNVYAGGLQIADEEVRRSMLSVVRRHWGLGARVLASVFMPEGDADELRRFARLQRQGASPETAASLLERSYEIDGTDAYRRIVAPALVLHRRDDRAIPYECGLEVASLIPGARFVPLEGSHHLPWLGACALCSPRCRHSSRSATIRSPLPSPPERPAARPSVGANGRYSRSSPRALAIRRSPSGCSSVRTLCTATSPTSAPSCASPLALPRRRRERASA
jgi:pimeloyl-ACP methyl ester carboxylesterase